MDLQGELQTSPNAWTIRNYLGSFNDHTPAITLPDGSTAVANGAPAQLTITNISPNPDIGEIFNPGVQTNPSNAGGVPGQSVDGTSVGTSSGAIGSSTTFSLPNLLDQVTGGVTSLFSGGGWFSIVFLLVVVYLLAKHWKV